MRVEDNGKQILIGVYTGGIAFRKFPAQTAITVWCDVEQPDVGHIPVRLRAVYGDEQRELFSATLEMSVAAPSQSANFVFKFPLSVSVPGKLRIFMGQHDDQWEEIKAIDVIQRALPSSAAPQPT
jgi:hypothetical protein